MATREQNKSNSDNRKNSHRAEHQSSHTKREHQHSSDKDEKGTGSGRNEKASAKHMPEDVISAAKEKIDHAIKVARDGVEVAHEIMDAMKRIKRL